MTLNEQVVVFRLGTDRYAVPMSSVQEIIRYQAPRSVAAPDPSVIGVISLRGSVIPVHDLGVALGLGSAVDEHAEIVVVETPSGTGGVVVDDVDEVLGLADDAVKDPPAAGGPGVAGILDLEDGLVVLLDLDDLLAEVDLAPAEALAA